MLLTSANKITASFRDLQGVGNTSSRLWLSASHLGIWEFVLFGFRKGLGEIK